tara:strand:- start:6043 stop:6345 length:303 start_codon:yes stop_codon:yes gene_type:complete
MHLTFWMLLESRITNKSNAASSLSLCALDQVLSGQCSASAGQVATSETGSDITSWSNASAGTKEAAGITDGFYHAKQCSFSDGDLLAPNIVSGVNIFGVI